jgi:SPX domain
MLCATLTCTTLGTAKCFHPKILLTVDDGLAVFADLSPETKMALGYLINQRKPPQPDSTIGIVDVQGLRGNSSISTYFYEASEIATSPASEEIVDEATSDVTKIFGIDEELAQCEVRKCRSESCSLEPSECDVAELSSKKHSVEITLHADSEFFHTLQSELAMIDNIQSKQKLELILEIDDLSNRLSAVVAPTKAGVASDIYVWRDIFSLYRDASAFFATTERDHAARSAEQARKRIQWFSDQLVDKSMVQSCINLKFILGLQIQEQKKSIVVGGFSQNQSITPSLHFVQRDERYSSP